MTRLIIFLIMCTVSTACSASERAIPSCIGDFCFMGKLPEEKTVRAVFGGGSKTLLPQGVASYCYRLQEKIGSPLYALFILKKFESEPKVVTVRVSTTEICTGATSLNSDVNLLTREGIGVGTAHSKVLEIYGLPRYSLQRPSREVVEDFFGPGRLPNMVSVSQYDSGNIRDLLGARFFYQHGVVIGIDISVDE